MIPILLNHEPARIIGHASMIGSSLLIEFIPELAPTREQFLTMFGECAGLRIYKTETRQLDPNIYVLGAEVLEFSLISRPAVSA